MYCDFISSRSPFCQSVEMLPGIGETYGKRLRSAGYTTVQDVMREFLKVNGNESQFKFWLQSVTNANSRWADHCYLGLVGLCKQNVKHVEQPSKQAPILDRSVSRQEVNKSPGPVLGRDTSNRSSNKTNGLLEINQTQLLFEPPKFTSTPAKYETSSTLSNSGQHFTRLESKIIKMEEDMKSFKTDFEKLKKQNVEIMVSMKTVGEHFTRPESKITRIEADMKSLKENFEQLEKRNAEQLVVIKNFQSVISNLTKADVSYKLTSQLQHQELKKHVETNSRMIVMEMKKTLSEGIQSIEEQLCRKAEKVEKGTQTEELTTSENQIKEMTDEGVDRKKSKRCSWLCWIV